MVLQRALVSVQALTPSQVVGCQPLPHDCDFGLSFHFNEKRITCLNRQQGIHMVISQDLIKTATEQFFLVLELTICLKGVHE